MINTSQIRLKIASPEEILSWSYGEIVKPETINYRTQKPEKEGLFSEAIFGPTKDYECYCGKYRRIRYRGITCDRCGVEVTRSIVRRERMGHITLAAPVAHIWFMRGIPSKMAMILGASLPDLEKVIYFAGYIVMAMNDELKAEAMKKIEGEFRSRIKNAKDEEEEIKLREIKEKEKIQLRSLKKYQILSELEYRDLSLKYGEVFEASIGAGAVRKLYEEMDLDEMIKEMDVELKKTDNPLYRNKVMRRLRLLKGMKSAGIKPEWMVLRYLPVIPPALRPMVPLDGGRFATSDLNDLYRRVINRNNRLKHLLELKAPEVITRNEKRMLQEAVDALIDNAMRRGQTLVAASTGQKRALKSLADMLKGKQGRFRQNLLGKRVDYSGRSVIVIGPELDMDQCGLPKHMALELFKPFVIQKLINKGLAHVIRSANRLIDQETPEVWEALEEAIEGKLVLLNRAPTLHRLSVQAFKPLLIEGKAIKIPAVVVKAFNADFDGDQMAVHLPLTEDAQKEARELILSTHGILKPATGEPVATPHQDMVLGCYYMTTIGKDAIGAGKIFYSKEDAILAYQNRNIGLRASIKLPRGAFSKKFEEENKVIETTVGRIIFNDSLPDDLEYINRPLDKSGLSTIEAKILAKYGQDTTVEFLNKIKDFGFKYATVSGISMSMDNLYVPQEKKAIIKEAEGEVVKNEQLYEQGLLTEYERKSKAIDIWTSAKSRISKIVRGSLDSENPVFMMVDSKARGTWGVIDQLVGMRGLVNNPTGEIIELPVKASFKEGMNVLEYFISTHGARKGLVDTALRTATAGYLTRRLVDVAQDVIVRVENCGDKEGYTMYAEDGKFMNVGLGKRLIGRTIMTEIKDKDGKTIVKKGKMVFKEDVERINESGLEKIKVRSVVVCKALEGVCKICYGFDLSKNKPVEVGEAVGIVTAQAIGEPGTQMTMRTFHTGGIAGGSDITMGLPRVEEIFEARPPQVKAVICDVDGIVDEIEETTKQIIVKVTVSETGETREYAIPPGINSWVSKGDLTHVGQQLSDGHVDLKELFKTSGSVADVARHIVREVQRVYFTTGEGINDKHIELIVKQMFSRVRILDPGDTSLLSGDIIEKRKIIEENQKAEEAGKQPAAFEQLLLGITKVSLSTESFLSAASFQETAKVLIEAAVAGKSDPLKGLKENVIIGRLIPAGTGLKVKEDVEEKEEEKKE